MREIAPGEMIQATIAPLDNHPVEVWQHCEGNPSTSITNLGSVAGAEFGLWEMSAGSLLDVESEEVFLVLTGEATVEFLEPKLPTLRLFPGSIVRLADGMQTRWTIHKRPLRKLYLAARVPPDNSALTSEL
ncbi:cupin domain-containing protein [Arthrobacter sp. ISL-95]|uniref:cupin domain-containing protein n=1 Tax=Arthrobacter sp. ISL-95 TaxID=2819116 RepID=UPI001BE70289|nr:cupin domain-containing protein [Arthrobacter sp. ISL-95]MBT2588504.1 DUF861 domain-containing protein [Arthrobacter sp. ISL-95]